jgi:hypothetical protein
MESDPWLAVHIDNHIGSNGGSMLVDFETLIRKLLVNPILTLQDYSTTPDEHRIREVAEEAAAWLLRVADPHFIFIPILGYLGGTPVPLPGNGEVRRFTDEELAFLIRSSAILPVQSQWDEPDDNVRIIPAHLQFGFVCDHRCRRRFGLVDPAQAPEFWPDGHEAQTIDEQTDRFIDAVRLVTSGRVWRGPRIIAGDPCSPLGMPGYSSDLRVRPGPRSDAAVPAEVLELLEVFGGLGTAPQVLRRHVRRFAEAAYRDSPADRLVDLVICLEGMLADRRAESTYKVARRASAVARLEHVTPAMVRSFMTRAYDARSKIVHGGDPIAVSLSGKRCEFEVMARDMDRVTRAIIRCALETREIDVGRWADDRIDASLEAFRAD